jgi:hypothetical protein
MSDGVRIACTITRSTATHSHVTLTTNVGLCQTLLELTRHSEITQLDLTLFVGEQVCWLDVCTKCKSLELSILDHQPWTPPTTHLDA